MESETPAAIRESPLTNCVTTVTPTGTITPYLAAATDGGRWRRLASGVWRLASGYTSYKSICARWSFPE
jgi:hypothetical protein